MSQALPLRFAIGGLLAGSLLLAVGCQQDKVDPTIPPSLNFVLLDAQGQNLLTSTTTPLTVSAVNAAGQTISLGAECQGGGCTMVRQAAPGQKYPYYYSTMDAPSGSSNKGIRSWYLSLGGKTDTLYLDMQKSAYAQVLFNGRLATIDPDQQPLYVFRRRR